MNIAYTIISFLFAVSLFAKIIIHVYLDNSQGYKIVVSPVSSWIYLFPYDKDVSDEFVKKKTFCNYLQKIMLLFFILVILSLALKIFLR
jgi:hypothetical protein